MWFLRAIWSLIAWPLAFVLMTLSFLVSLPFWPFVPFERFQRQIPSPFFWRVLYCTLSRVTFLYDSKYDVSRNCVYTANHTSMLDAHVCVGAIHHPFCGVENAAHFLVPVYGWLMRAANGIPVPRGAKRTEALVEATKERASRGISVLTFPEAHRTMDGRVRPFRRGAFVMAREAGLPIVPIGIRGMYHVLPKGSWVVNPGHLEIFMGRAYETQGLSDAELEALVEEVHRVIANWVENGVLPEGTVTQKSPRSAD